MTLDELIKRTEARLSAETNTKRKAEIAADLAMYARAKAECDDEDDEDDDEKKSKKSSKAMPYKKSEEEAKHSEEEEAKSAKHSEEEAKMRGKAKKGEEDDEDEESSAKSALALLERATGLKGSAAIGAAAGSFARLDRVEKDTAELKAASVETERSALMKKAERFVPKAALNAAAEHMKLPALRAYVAEVAKGEPLVPTEDGDLLIPRATTPGTEATLPKSVIAQIDEAMNGCPPNYDRKKFREELVAAVTTSLKSEQLNGAGGRY